VTTGAPARRVVSLVPSVTDTLVALGAGDSIVGISTDCDQPVPEAPVAVVTRPVVPASLAASSPREADGMVRERLACGEALYGVDLELLCSLRPDILFGQDSCRVCAVPAAGLGEVLRGRGLECEVVSVDPERLEDVAESFERVGAAIGRGEAGRLLAARFRGDLAELTGAGGFVPGGARRVLVLDWLDPPFVAGHWVPELVESAGGVAVLGEAGKPSREVAPSEVAEAGAEILVVAPCGLDLAQSCAAAASPLVAASGAGRVLALDGRLFFSRPGPRLVEGARALAALLSAGGVPSGYERVACEVTA